MVITMTVVLVVEDPESHILNPTPLAIKIPKSLDVGTRLRNLGPLLGCLLWTLRFWGYRPRVLNQLPTLLFSSDLPSLRRVAHPRKALASARSRTFAMPSRVGASPETEQDPLSKEYRTLKPGYCTVGFLIWIKEYRCESYSDPLCFFGIFLN